MKVQCTRLYQLYDDDGIVLKMRPIDADFTFFSSELTLAAIFGNARASKELKVISRLGRAF
jgi:hypothetical protein